LPRLIGVRRTQDLMLTNRRLSALEAAQWGLVTEVVPDDDLAPRTDVLVAEMAGAARASSSAVKKLLLMTFGHGLEEQMEIEGRIIAACADTPDGREGIDAFVNKRAAKFA
jgi:2-(1,2-epoxy-1,2-dihydrophenyl)acetyl-CoA isomerase